MKIIIKKYAGLIAALALTSLPSFAVSMPVCISLTPQAQVPNLPLAKITAIIAQQGFEMGGMPGLLVGIVDGKQTALISCGETAKDNNQRPDGKTVWQIGSVSKVVTTTILARMIVNGEVKLTDPVQTYLPNNVIAPTYRGQPITLVDLATHTSALPRQLPGYDDQDNYQENITYNQPTFYQFLPKYQLPRQPGTYYEYSNVGFGFLGNILATKENLSFEQLVNKYMVKQLGMIDTTTIPTPAQKAREAKSYWLNGDLIVKDWPFDFERPSGGVYSTGDDLLRFLQYQLNLLPVANSIAANQIAHATYIYRDELTDPTTLPADGMALGWEVDYPHQGLPVVLTKNGWVSGFTTWVMIMPSKKIGVFSISNKPYLPMKEALNNVLGVLNTTEH